MYAEETSYGSGGTPSGSNDFGKLTNVTLNMDNALIQSQGLGEGRNVTKTKLGNFAITGSMSGEVLDFTPLQYAIGDRQGAGTSGDPYEFVEQDFLDYSDGLKTLQLEIGSKSHSNHSVKNVTGCFFDSLSYSGTVGDTLKFSASFNASSITEGTSAVTYTNPSEAPFAVSEITVTDGTNTINVESFNWSINNGSTSIYELGSRTTSNIGIGSRRYSLTLTMVYDFNDTSATLSGIELLKYFFGGASQTTPLSTSDPTALTIKLAISEGASSGDRVASIDLENCYFQSWSHPINLNDGRLSVTVNIVGQAGLTDGSDNVPVRIYTI